MLLIDQLKPVGRHNGVTCVGAGIDVDVIGVRRRTPWADERTARGGVNPKRPAEIRLKRRSQPVGRKISELIVAGGVELGYG